MTALNFNFNMYVVRMINVTHAAIEGISVTVKTPYVSGVVLQQCSHLHIQSITERNNDNNGFVSNECGIVVYESSDIEMNSLRASNFSYGVWLYKSRNTSMFNVTAVHIRYNGIRLYYSTNTSMTNVSAAHNGGRIGIFLYHSTDTSMANVSATHSRIFGIFLYNCTDTNMMNVSAEHNQRSGIGIQNTANTYITNTTSLIEASNTINIVLNYTTFTNMDAPSTASDTSEPTNLSAVITLYNSTLIIRDSRFTDNSISSIKAIRSNVTMSGEVLFHNNTASSGTCLIFAKNSF